MILFLLLCFVAPALASLGVRAAGSQPNSWRSADWSSSGLARRLHDDAPAAVYVMAARTGGLKGALAVHSWIVTKARERRYTRYDKVGWGSPIRVNLSCRWPLVLQHPETLLALHGPRPPG
jgi:hypothetical protein